MEVKILNDRLKNIWFAPTNNKETIVQKIDFGLQQKMLEVFSIGDFYSYVFDLSTMSFIHLSNGVEKMLGWSPEEFTPSFVIEHIHPNDREWFVNAENTVGKFFASLKPENIFDYKVRYDYRLQKKNGDFAQILQQVVVASHTPDGAILNTMGVHTDITHLKTANSRNLGFIGLNGKESILDYPVKKYSLPKEKNVFSKREKEILSLIWEGRETKEIASQLFLSTETVDTHRRNMLKKSNVNNSIGLIRYALSIGEL